jgi:anaerobic magnesium-protoporphyrin IX monomethyl ester cyclase
MADIVLVQPPIRDFYLTAKRTIPYGLACIGAALLQEGFAVDLVDALATAKSRVLELPAAMDYLDEFYGKPDRSPFALFHHYRHFGYSFQHIGDQVRRRRPFLVGVASLCTAYGDEALQTAETIKKFHPECHIVLGGHHPTAMPEQVMQCPAIDYVVRGEGEAALPALAKALRTGASIASVPGLVWRQPDGTLQMNAPARIERLDAYPAPATHLIRQRFYRRGKHGGAALVASRGCPLRCSYCSLGVASHLPYRRRSVQAVLRELETAVVRDGARFIDFEDENLSLTRSWFLELLNGIQERFAPYGLELRAMNGLLPTTLDDTLVRAMKNAGFRTLNLSLGSTSREQLKRFQRPDVIAALDHALALAEQYGLDAVAYVIAGAPGQDPVESLEDLLFLASRRVLAGVSIYYPAPGSADYRLCEAAGLLPSKLSLMRSTAFPITDTTTRVEAVTLLRLGRILNFGKSLLDQGQELPPPKAYRDSNLADVADRTELGRFLLQWFLDDGVIRGVTPGGLVFAHTAASHLTRRFLDGLKKILLRGTH